MKLVARQEAIQQGLNRYFTGKPCLRGHISERAVSHRGCLRCHADNEELWRDKNLQASRARDKKSRDIVGSSRHLKSQHTEESWKKQLEYFRVKNHERRDLTAGSLSPDIRQKHFEAQKGLCNGCSCELDDSAHIDHKIPISRGGMNLDENTQLLCAYCNLSKGSKTMTEWKGN